MKLIHQGGLHNHGNNDTHTCSVPIEIISCLNITIMILVTRYIVLVKTCASHKIFYLNRYIEKPGDALITQFSDIIEQIKSQPSAQITMITMITYSYTMSEICNFVQKLTYICCGHIRGRRAKQFRFAEI